MVEYLVSASLACGYLFANLLVGVGVLVLEAEVFEFGLDSKQAQPVGQWSVDIQSLARNLICTRVRQSIR